MGGPFQSSPLPYRESIDAILAKNLVAARAAVGMTQHELAKLSRVSRATIAQLETGSSDPRLSTIFEIGHALGISPILLLFGQDDVAALIKAAGQLHSKLPLDPKTVSRMRDYLASGMLKDRVRAARLGAAAAAQTPTPSISVPVSAAIFSAISPGDGSNLGILLGEFFATKIPRQTERPTKRPSPKELHVTA